MYRAFEKLFVNGCRSPIIREPAVDFRENSSATSTPRASRIMTIEGQKPARSVVSILDWSDVDGGCMLRPSLVALFAESRS